jgi:hypothetical protein
MAKIDLIPKTDLAFAAQMRTFQQNIAQHAASLGVTPEQVAAQSADSEHYNYVVSSQQQMLNISKAWTTWRKTARKGKTQTDGTVLEQNIPAANLPPAPPAVAAGVEKRFRALLRQVKASPNYIPATGVELGIEAASLAAPDYAVIQPKITAKVNGDHVALGWDWQGCRTFLDLCEFQVNRNDGHGFGPLTSSVHPGCKDETPFPATPTVWQYRAIYHADGKRTGQWSQVVSVTVGA